MQKKKRGRPAGKVAKTRASKTTSSFNTGDLAGILFSTMQDLRSGKVEAKEANAVAAQSREICRIAKIHLDTARLTGNANYVTNVAGLISG